MVEHWILAHQQVFSSLLSTLAREVVYSTVLFGVVLLLWRLVWRDGEPTDPAPLISDWQQSR